MEQRLRATSPEELPRVVNALHDTWFDVDGLDFDKEARTVTLRFWRSSRRAGQGRPDAECVIAGVTELTVNDTQRVGFYDLNEMRYHAGELRITTGVPLDLALRVERVDVSLHVTSDTGG